jgi:hypothetical protein
MVVVAKIKYYLLATIILALAIIGTMCWRLHSGSYTLNQSNFSTNTLTLIENNTHLKFPEGSRGLNMIYDAEHTDPSFIAKIEIPSNEVSDLETQILDKPKGDYHPIGLMSEKTPWWNPAKSEIIIASQYTADSSFINLVLCQRSDQVILFVEWFAF